MSFVLKDFWKTLRRKETWKQGGVILRRSHKDVRARRVVFIALFVLLYFVGYGIYIYFSAKEVGIWPSLTGIGITTVMIVVISAYRKYKPAETDGPVTLGISTPPPIEAAPEYGINRKLRLELAKLCLLHAILADRAASEQFLQTKTLPESTEVVTRQKHLAVVREYGMFQELATLERDLLLLPDGHWSDDMIAQGAMLLEPVRLLRWILCVDDSLPLIGASLVANFEVSSATVLEPEKLFRGEKAISIDALRVALLASERYFHRCGLREYLAGYSRLKTKKP